MKNKYILIGIIGVVGLALYFKFGKKNKILENAKDSKSDDNSIKDSPVTTAVVYDSNTPDPPAPEIDDLSGSDRVVDLPHPKIITLNTVNTNIGLQKEYSLPLQCSKIFTNYYNGVKHIYNWNNGSPTLTKVYTTDIMILPESSEINAEYLDKTIKYKVVPPILVKISKDTFLKACEDFKSGKYRDSTKSGMVTENLGIGWNVN